MQATAKAEHIFGSLESENVVMLIERWCELGYMI